MGKAYYNEIDPKAAQWLRNLVKEQLIADGDVDERSIEDVRPSDLRGYTQCHFFAGIGVWSYALRRAGWGDDRPVWTGSCPCQPFSSAGKGDGFADERHLWPAFYHLIKQCKPPVVFGEQVEAAIRHSWLDAVQTDMEESGYAFGALGLPAAGLGAPHIRARIFFVGAKGLADVHQDGCSSWGAVRPVRQEHDAEHGSNSRGVAHTNDTERRAEASGRNLCDGKGPGRAQGSGYAQGCGCDERGNLGNPSSIRCDGRRSTEGAPSEERLQPRPEPVGELSGRVEGLGRVGVGLVANANHEGLEGRGRVRECASELASGQSGVVSGPGPVNGHWRDADWIPCRDSKIRPIEPGSTPLVDGSATRVGFSGAVERLDIPGMLRGYGNAIVAPVAEEFIRAYMTCNQN